MRIAVWNVAFLGDSLLTLPLLQVLHQAYPDATLDFWVRSSYCSLYQGQKFYTTYGYDNKDRRISSLRSLARQIASMDYDIWINTHPSYRSSYILYSSQAKTTISYTTPFINTYLSTYSISRNPKLHEIDRLLTLTTPLDISKEYTLPCYQLDSTTLEEVQSICYQHGDSPRIALAIGAMWATKRWLPEHFARIIILAQQHGYTIYFVGGGIEEERIVQQILKLANVNLGDGVYSYINAPLIITAGILAQSTLCCGNDTGLMHLAWIQNIPTIALYGPTSAEQGFQPLSKGSQSLGIALSCRPCGKHGAHHCKKKHFRCMKELSPEYVWEVIEQSIKAQWTENRI